MSLTVRWEGMERYKTLFAATAAFATIMVTAGHIRHPHDASRPSPARAAALDPVPSTGTVSATAPIWAARPIQDVAVDLHASTAAPTIVASSASTEDATTFEPYSTASLLTQPVVALAAAPHPVRAAKPRRHSATVSEGGRRAVSATPARPIERVAAGQKPAAGSAPGAGELGPIGSLLRGLGIGREG